MNPLFETPLRREALLAVPPAEGGRTVAVAVHRNHSFELTASVLPPFLALAGLKAEFILGAYDDSLSFADMPQADLHLIWLDALRYESRTLSDLLPERTAALRALGAKNVLVACCGLSEAASFSLPGAELFDCDSILAPLGGEAFDERLAPYSGTRLSNAAMLELARALGTRGIPSFFPQPLKGVVLDLDGTLHKGVLGEDGPEGVVPCVELQRFLRGLKDKGFFLALASKNDAADVEALFAARADYPLRREDFAAVSVNWEPKNDALENIAAALHVGLESLLFADDNPGERLLVSRTLPQVHVLQADTPEEMLAGLRLYPGLQKNTFLKEDGLRTADIQAEAGRKRLRAALTPEEYMRDLAMQVTLSFNPGNLEERVYELLHKTNQFVLSSLRPARKALAAWFTEPGRCVITAALKDRLADSGTIAALLARRDGTGTAVDEVVVSCRALGRGIEDGMIKAMLRLAAEALGCAPPVRLAYTVSARNKPAVDWLKSLPASEAFPVEAERGEIVLNALPEAFLPGLHILRPENETRQ